MWVLTDVQDSSATMLLSVVPAEWVSDRFSLLCGGKTQCWALSHKKLSGKAGQCHTRNSGGSLSKHCGFG